MDDDVRPGDAARLLSRVSGIGPRAEAREEQSADPVERAVRQLVRVYLPDVLPVLTPACVDQHERWPTGPPSDEGHDPPWVDDAQRSPSHDAA